MFRPLRGRPNDSLKGVNAGNIRAIQNLVKPSLCIQALSQTLPTLCTIFWPKECRQEGRGHKHARTITRPTYLCVEIKCLDEGQRTKSLQI